MQYCITTAFVIFFMNQSLIIGDFKNLLFVPLQIPYQSQKSLQNKVAEIKFFRFELNANF